MRGTFAPIANCLDYIQQGVIHRNVKPANIIVAALSDFSLAQTRTPSKFILPARVAGTPTFMSPEQARGEAVDGRSFSFGCILFQCRAGGSSPFAEKTRLQLDSQSTSRSDFKGSSSRIRRT